MSEHNHHDRENPCPVCHNESEEIARLRAELTDSELQRKACHESHVNCERDLAGARKSADNLRAEVEVKSACVKAQAQALTDLRADLAAEVEKVRIKDEALVDAKRGIWSDGKVIRTGWRGHPVMQCGSCNSESEQTTFIHNGVQWYQCCLCRNCWTVKQEAQ